MFTLSWFFSKCVRSQNYIIYRINEPPVFYFDWIHFSDIPSILKREINYHINLSSLFPSVYRMLLKLPHVSVTQYHLQGGYHIKGKFTIYIKNNKGFEISPSLTSCARLETDIVLKWIDAGRIWRNFLDFGVSCLVVCCSLMHFLLGVTEVEPCGFVTVLATWSVEFSAEVLNAAIHVPRGTTKLQSSIL